jgi:hypothetical protein
MDKMLTPNGGLPILGNDFAYMQDAQSAGTNAILRVFSDLSQGGMVVNGCKFSLVGSTYHISNGWVMMEFTGGDTGITDPADLQDGVVIERYIYEENTAPSSRTMADNSTKTVWQRRRARLVTGAVGVPTFTVTDSIRLEYLMALATQVITHVSVPMLDFENNWGVPQNTFQPRIIKRGKMCFFKGLLATGSMSSTSYTQIFTIQQDFRPAYRRYYICAMPNKDWGIVDIQTDGTVYVIVPNFDSQNPPALLDVSSISYETA